MLGAGEPIPERGTFEGVATAQAAQTLAERLGVECPIISTVAALVLTRICHWLWLLVHGLLSQSRSRLTALFRSCASVSVSTFTGLQGASSMVRAAATLPSSLPSNGGNTAATDYLKEKTYTKISHAFQPSISASLDRVGGTANFKQMLDIFNALPFMQSKPFNLDEYVTGEALNGLFTMLGKEETKIRTDPTARATDLLKQVFGQD